MCVSLSLFLAFSLSLDIHICLFELFVSFSLSLRRHPRLLHLHRRLIVEEASGLYGALQLQVKISQQL